MKHALILYVDRNRLMAAGGNLSGVVTLEIPPTVVSDLEVLHGDGLSQLIRQWFKQHAIAPASVLCILSDTTYFTKDIGNVPEAQQEEEAQKFFDAVPFDSLLTNVFAIGNQKKAVAISKSWYETLRQTLVSLGCRIEVSVPLFALGTLAAKRWLDEDLRAYVVKNLETLRRFSLVEAQTEESFASGKEEQAQPKPQRLTVLLGIFVLLVVALVLFVVLRR